VKLLFAASEMTPFAKTGGLGHVVGSLPAALTELGHEVACCLPSYRCVREAAREATQAGLSFSLLSLVCSPLFEHAATVNISANVRACPASLQLSHFHLLSV
jgi:glycogen synthase